MKFEVENYRIDGYCIVIDFAKPEWKVCSRLSLELSRLEDWVVKNQENVWQELSWDYYGNPYMKTVTVPFSDWLIYHISEIAVSKFLHDTVSSVK
jgi:hypothetical protein